MDCHGFPAVIMPHDVHRRDMCFSDHLDHAREFDPLGVDHELSHAGHPRPFALLGFFGMSRF
jgi:hypothetical protein